jgi:hypothetical protein
MSGLSWGEITVGLVLLGLAIAGLLLREAALWRQQVKDAEDREPDTYGDGQ